MMRDNQTFVLKPIRGTAMKNLKLIPSLSTGILVAGSILTSGTAGLAQTTTPRANDVFAVNAGGPAVSGWAADTDFVLGSQYSNSSTPVSLANLPQDDAPAAVYQDAREGDHFSYVFPALAPSTVYSVTLHFAELYFTAPGQREFNVAINGLPELTNFDIVAAAGGPFLATTMQFFVKSDANGVIEINFTRGAFDQPTVNAVEVATRVAG